MTNDAKLAQPDHPIHELIAQRWSPYAYDPQPVDRQQLLSCLEAARWSASSYNEQPWTFIVATRDNENDFQTMLECLLEGNQAWAKNAGVLIITIVCKTFTKNGKPNRVAEHDIGLAAGNLSLQATALGLYVHQMAGVNLAKAKQTYAIPDSHEPLTAIAIGHAAENLNDADEQLAERDKAPRTRKPVREIAFSGAWSDRREV